MPQGHIERYVRTVNGRVEWVTDHNRETHAGLPDANLAERTAAGVNRNGEHYIRTIHAADMAAVREVARHVGVTTHAVRQSGGNHFGRTGAYPHAYFDTQEDRNKVMAEVQRRHGGGASTAPTHEENARTIQQARDAESSAQQMEEANDFESAAAHWDHAEACWAARANSPTVAADLRSQAAQRAASCRHSASELRADIRNSEGMEQLAAASGHSTGPEAIHVIQPAQIIAAAEPAPATTPTPAPANSLEAFAANSAEQDRFFSNQRAGILDRRVWLENTQNGHNKMYAIDIRQVGEGKWVVNVAYGARNASRFTTQTKTRNPMSQAEANALVTRLKSDKVGSGYSVKDDSPTPRLASFSPLDNYQHPSVVPAAQAHVEAVAAARATPAAPAVTPAPAATPRPTTHAPAASTGPTLTQYEALRDAAFSTGNTARNTDTQNTPEAFLSSFAAYNAHNAAMPVARALSIRAGSDRGAPWHQERANHWLGKAKSQWTGAIKAALSQAAPGGGTGNAVSNAESTGTGYAAAKTALVSVAGILDKRPAGAVLPTGITDTQLAELRTDIEVRTKMLDVGNTIEMIDRRLTNSDKAMVAAELVRNAVRIGACPEAAKTKATALAGHIESAKTAFLALRDAMGNDEIEPVDIRAKATALTAACDTAHRALEALPKEVAWRMAPSATIKDLAKAALQADQEATRRKALPRKADPRYLAMKETAHAAASEAHAAASGTDRAKMVRALEAHKLAAVTHYHAALAKKGDERSALMAKANEHAQHARDFVAKLNRR